MFITILKRLTDKQKADFDAFIEEDLTNWERYNIKLLEKASYSRIQIKGLFPNS
jgi:hypothetical protein